jgi:ribosomal protein L12E/L44/L45/RPP1/RPP2
MYCAWKASARKRRTWREKMGGGHDAKTGRNAEEEEEEEEEEEKMSYVCFIHMGVFI